MQLQKQNGSVILKKVIPEHLTPVIYKLRECGCEIDISKDTIILNASKRLNSIEIKTMPHPGFPTDMQSIFASILTTANGTSIIVENIFENRYKYASEFIKMGAKIKIEGKICIIKGTKKLHGANVDAKDLRGGAALVLAGLNAKGKTIVNNAEYILRGYENLDEKLNSLGAKIELI